MFGAGTACVVCPVNRILYEGQVGILSSLQTKYRNSMRPHCVLPSVLFCFFLSDTRLSGISDCDF